MQVFPFVVVAWILGVGLYGVVTSRHLVHQIICLIVVQSSTYVLLLGVGYVTGAVSPYFSMSRTIPLRSIPWCRRAR
jgi:multicomponent Na+:H+ antiporter subunit C